MPEGTHLVQNEFPTDICSFQISVSIRPTLAVLAHTVARGSGFIRVEDGSLEFCGLTLYE